MRGWQARLPLRRMDLAATGALVREGVESGGKAAWEPPSRLVYRGERCDFEGAFRAPSPFLGHLCKDALHKAPCKKCRQALHNCAFAALAYSPRISHIRPGCNTISVGDILCAARQCSHLAALKRV